MSIINEAIQKTRKEFELKNQIVRQSISPPSPVKNPRIRPAVSESSDIKWTAVIFISLVFIISLLGSALVYKHISGAGLKNRNNLMALEPAPGNAPPAINYHKTSHLFSNARAKEASKLTGIVYGPDDKWAIINDRIAREDDSVLGGTLTHISKDSVVIEKNDGGKIVLELR